MGYLGHGCETKVLGALIGLLGHNLIDEKYGCSFVTIYYFEDHFGLWAWWL